MYLSLDEKRYSLYVNYFTNIFPFNLSNLPIGKINCVNLTMNDRIKKTNSAKFAVFGPVNHKTMFPKNFCP